MNIKEYIESGNLEAYLLGALSPEEEAQVQADIAMYPELANELAAIEETLLNMANSGAVSPPAGLDEKIWSAINAGAVSGATSEMFTSQPGPLHNNPARTIPLQPGPPAMKQSNFRYAAIWVALVVSVALNLLFWYQNNAQKSAYLAMNSKFDSLASSTKALAQVAENYNKGKDMMADTAMQTIVMHTVLKGHPMAATLYWSKDKSEAFVMMDALPVPPKGMQYQLWVIQGGKPVDMGVLPNNMANTALIQRVDKPVNNGEAFAISLEKEGGSPTPTAQNIYVMGKT